MSGFFLVNFFPLTSSTDAVVMILSAALLNVKWVLPDSYLFHGENSYGGTSVHFT